MGTNTLTAGEERIEQSLSEIDFAALRRKKFTPSPVAWEDQFLYFLMIDRFSDGKEKGGYGDINAKPVSAGSTPLFKSDDGGKVDRDQWLKASGGWQGGTLKGLRGKLGYLKRLGVTAIW